MVGLNSNPVRLLSSRPLAGSEGEALTLKAVRAERIARRIEAVTAAEAGHPFWGNQWTEHAKDPKNDPAGEPRGKIKHAVLVVGGKRFRGSAHWLAYNEAEKELGDPGEDLKKIAEFQKMQGFETESGHYLDRDQALKYVGVENVNETAQNRIKKLNDKKLSAQDIELKASGGELYTRDAVQAAEDTAQDNYHEKARVVAEGIYKAEIDGWLSELNFKTVSGIKRKDDLDEIIAGLAAMGVAWFLAMMLAAKKARKTTARALSAHQGFANTPDEDVLEAFAASRKQPLEAFPEAVRVKVAESLKRGLAGGESPKALARRTNEVFNEISEGAAQRVAATEAQVTYGVSQAEALALAGYRSKVWVTMGDDRVRDSHLLCEDQGAVPVSSPFQNGLMFPGDPNGPAEEVINCRCNLGGGVK